MDSIPLGVIANGVGVGALLVLLFWMLATGRLFTRRQYDDAMHIGNEWRTESRIKDAQIAEKDEQIRLLAEVGKTVEQLARGLQQRMKP